MNFAIPCALFSNIMKSSRAVLREQFPTALMIMLAFSALYLISYLWARRSQAMSISDASVMALTVGFPNSAAIALPLLDGVYGPESTVTAALSIVIGSITISPLTLALLEADKQSGGNGISIWQILRNFPRALIRPVVWAPLLALVGVFFGIHLPPLATGTLTTLGRSATGSALILTGLVVSAQSFQLNGSVLITTLLKLVGQPLFALSMMLLFQMDRDDLRNITVVSAIPDGFFGLVFGKGFDHTPETASSGLIGTYLIGWVTLPLWMLLMAKFF
jgi:malonate transporter and related proteins